MTTILINYASIAMNYVNSKFKTKWPVKYPGGEEGIVAIEYVLIAALVAVAIVAGATFLGGELNTFFGYVGNTVNNAMTP
jgi:pilus assembly protein Flp/PilA